MGGLAFICSFCSFAYLFMTVCMFSQSLPAYIVNNESGLPSGRVSST